MNLFLYYRLPWSQTFDQTFRLPLITNGLISTNAKTIIDKHRQNFLVYKIIDNPYRQFLNKFCSTKKDCRFFHNKVPQNYFQFSFFSHWRYRENGQRNRSCPSTRCLLEWTVKRVQQEHTVYCLQDQKHPYD